MEKLRSGVKVYQLIDLDDNGSKVLIGTINDIRQFIKNRWEFFSEHINEVFDTEFIEEEFYCYVDDDNNLMMVLNNLGYKAIEECEVPIEDFFI